MGGVKHAVLGLVIEQPSYGYKLAQRLEDRCGSWGWQRAGVYGALDQLARERLVVSLPQNDAADTGRAGARTIYEATPQGVDYFHDWLLESCSPSPLRQDLDLKILLSRAEYLPQLIEQTWAQEQQCLQALDALRQRAQSGRAGAPLTWAEARTVLQRDAEIKLRQVRIEWLQDVRRVMRLMLDAPAGAHGNGST